jgi:hypothetical protein
VILRKYIVWIALVFTLIACIWLNWQDNLKTEPILIVNKHTSKQLDKHSPALFNIKQLSLRAQDITMPKNVFPSLIAKNSQNDMVQEKTTNLPANPYTYAGKISEDGIWTVFLTDGSNNYVVKAGDRLQGGWQLKGVKMDELTMLYEPYKREIKLEIGVAL